VRYDEISIKPSSRPSRRRWPGVRGLPEDTTEENIQARIRGVLLMALSNKFGSIVLTTGNKSEMATGYCTLYGDMAGGFAVIKDVLKTVGVPARALAQRNDPYGTGANPIPSASSRARPAPNCGPTRSTRTACRPTRSWTASWRATWRTTRASTRSSPPGFDRAGGGAGGAPDPHQRIQAPQAPVGIRVTHRSFGKDWRYPITGKFSPDYNDSLERPMKQITAIVKAFKLEEVREGWPNAGVTG
jgi:NAD+ synthase (glutamine-hydrolysing)